MSKYAETTTNFKDEQCLVDALLEMGFTLDMIERHEKGKNLRGYHDEIRPEIANVIINRKYVNQVLSGGASNDLGFVRRTDGTFGAIISEYDNGKWNRGNKWVGGLKAAYSKHDAIKKATKMGFKYSGAIKKNGKTELTFVKA